MIGWLYGGGGYWGITQVGQTEELLNFGYEPDMLLANSVGVFNAACLLAYGAKRMKSFWLEVVEKSGQNLVFPRTSGAFFRFITLKPYIFSDDGVRYLISLLDLKKVCDSFRPLLVMTYNMSRKEPRIFSTHDEEVQKDPERLRLIFRAAVAYPGIFSPVEIDGELYRDSVEASTRPLFERGCTRVFALITDPLDHEPPRTISWPMAMRGVGHQITDMSMFEEKRTYGDKLTPLRPSRYVGKLSRISFRNPKIRDGKVIHEGDLTREYRESKEITRRTLKEELFLKSRY